MPSFDIVSKVDWHEVDNALNQANKELGQRFDFKNTSTSVKLVEESFVIESSDEFKVKSAVEVLEGKLAKRGVPLAVLLRGEIEPAASGRARQSIKVRSGLEQDTGRALVKAVKESKLKVQASIQADTVRVSGKKRDDLQAVITLVKSGQFAQPLQFENYRD